MHYLQLLKGIELLLYFLIHSNDKKEKKEKKEKKVILSVESIALLPSLKSNPFSFPE